MHSAAETSSTGAAERPTAPAAPAGPVLFVHVAMGATPEYRVHLTLASYAGANGVPCAVLSSASDPLPQAPTHSPESVEVELPERPERRGPLRKIGLAVWKARFFVAASRGGLRWAKRANPSAVYCSQHGTDMLVAYIISRRLRIPMIVHLHYTMGPWFGRFSERFLRRTKTIFAVSEFIRTTALLRGVRPEAVHTVHNCVDLSTDSAPAQQADLDSLRPLVVVAVGRLDPGKGHDALIRALATVRRQRDDVELLICGVASWGHNDQVLRQLCKELEVTDAVRFLGFRSDVDAILRRADVFCLPSELEPFGLVYLEAMRAELPIIALHSGGVPEIVIDGVTGRLVYPGDVDALADALLSLLGDADLRKAQGAAGRTRLETVFSSEVVGPHWLHLLSAAVAGRRS